MTRSGSASPRIPKARLGAMVEEATVDCYNESEQLAGWFTMIDQNLAVPFETVVLGVTRHCRACRSHRQRQKDNGRRLEIWVIGTRPVEKIDRSIFKVVISPSFRSCTDLPSGLCHVPTEYRQRESARSPTRCLRKTMRSARENELTDRCGVLTCRKATGSHAPG